MRVSFPLTGVTYRSTDLYTHKSLASNGLDVIQLSVRRRDRVAEVIGVRLDGYERAYNNDDSHCCFPNDYGTALATKKGALFVILFRNKP